MPLSEVRTGTRRYAGIEARPPSTKRVGGGAARFFALLQIPLSLAALGLVAALILRGPDSLLILHGFLTGEVSRLSLAEPEPSPTEAVPEPGAGGASGRRSAEAVDAGEPVAGGVEQTAQLPVPGSLDGAVSGATLKDFERRWLEDRRRVVREELAEHPPVVAEQIATRRPRLMVISAHRGVPKAVYTPSAGPGAPDYGAYLEGKLRETGTIVVEVKSREPSVIFATATRAVDWRFVFAEDAKVLAVHVEGALAPTITGVPRDVPLTVRSRAFGDRDAAGRVRQIAADEPDDANTREIRANLARFQESYPGLPMTIFEQHTLERVTLIDEGSETKSAGLD